MHNIIIATRVYMYSEHRPPQIPSLWCKQLQKLFFCWSYCRTTRGLTVCAVKPTAKEKASKRPDVTPAIHRSTEFAKVGSTHSSSPSTPLVNTYSGYATLWSWHHMHFRMRIDANKSGSDTHCIYGPTLCLYIGILTLTLMIFHHPCVGPIYARSLLWGTRTISVHVSLSVATHCTVLGVLHC